MSSSNARIAFVDVRKLGVESSQVFRQVAKRTALIPDDLQMRKRGRVLMNIYDRVKGRDDHQIPRSIVDVQLLPRLRYRKVFKRALKLRHAELISFQRVSDLKGSNRRLNAPSAGGCSFSLQSSASGIQNRRGRVNGLSQDQHGGILCLLLLHLTPVAALVNLALDCEPSDDCSHYCHRRSAEVSRKSDPVRWRSLRSGHKKRSYPKGKQKYGGRQSCAKRSNDKAQCPSIVPHRTTLPCAQSFVESQAA